jgi:hypothetical protein
MLSQKFYQNCRIKTATNLTFLLVKSAIASAESNCLLRLVFVNQADLLAEKLFSEAIASGITAITLNGSNLS